MRIITDEENEVWSIQEIGDFEWYLLAELPSTANFESSEKGRQRILPDAVDPGTDPEGASDWNQFVRPELEDGFARNVAIVSHALDSAEEETTPEGATLRRMRLPLDEAEIWYLVLNQARIILNEEQGVAQLEETLDENDPGSLDEKLALPMAQYEFYTAIQSYLIARIMDRD